MSAAAKPLKVVAEAPLKKSDGFVKIDLDTSAADLDVSAPTKEASPAKPTSNRGSPVKVTKLPESKSPAKPERKRPGVITAPKHDSPSKDPVPESPLRRK